MSATDFFTLVVQLVFVFLSPLSIFNYLQHRDVTRRDIALMFTSLALTIGIPVLLKALGLKIAWLSVVASLALIAQPYLMLRLVQYFRHVPLSIRRIALVAMLVNAAVIVLAPTPGPTILVIAIILYMVAIDGYAMIALIRGALTTTGVIRQRLRLAAAGSGFLALGLIILIFAALLPDLIDLFTVLVLVALMACAVSYYLGFAPPRWLRRTWQLIELRDYLSGAVRSASDTNTGITESLQRLNRSASQAVGGIAAGVAQRSEESGAWTLREASDPDMLARAFASGKAIIDQAVQQRAASPLYVSAVKDAALRAQLASVGAGSWLIVPMFVSERLWGVLIVFLRERSLFIEDDLSVLELFAHEIGITLTNYQLIDELRGYSESLERKVEDRTAALRESEQRYRDLNAALEQRVLDRTAQLESANKELEAFSYSVSHDLRAPLRSIDGFSRILIEDYAPQLEPEVQRYLNIVRSDTQQMGHLIDDLLEFSHLSRHELKKLIFDPTEMVHQILSDLQGERDGRDVQITVHDMPPLLADPSLFKQVYVNLLSNALKYTRKCDHAILEVGTQPDAETGKTTYYVRDNGAGFNMRYAHKLFGVFQRLHSADEYEGTGVGLAIVQRIINRHDGRIWADAEVDKGATFFFTL